MKAILLLVVLAALPLVGSAAASDDAPAACAWNPEYTGPIESASGGVLHFHDGAICTVHVHPPR